MTLSLRDLAAAILLAILSASASASGSYTKTMLVTSYCPCKVCCGPKAHGVTASGVPAKGALVAAPPSIPFGTRVSIPGYNGGRPVPVLDRGGAIKGDHLDVLFPTHRAALQWGKRYVKVTFYGK